MQRQYRLHREEDFARSRRDGVVYKHHLLMISVMSNGLSHNRYGFITAKSLGKAVQRNRTRRLLREAVRHWHPQLLVGHDIVVIARVPIVGQSLWQIVRAFESVFKKAKLAR